MAAELIELNPENLNLRTLEGVVERLRKGAVIAYPTDTIYAIGCDMNNGGAVDRVCKIKGVNPKKMNFSIICSDLSSLSNYAKNISNPVFKMMKTAFPGPYTFILDASSEIPRLLNPGKKTVGIRVPDHSIPLKMVELLGNPIVTTSVHDEDEILEYTTDPNKIFEKFYHELDLVIDGGNGLNEPSTVIDCSGTDITVVREGLGSIEELGLIT